MEKKYELVIAGEVAGEMEAIRKFHEDKKPGRGFLCLEDILDCLDRIQQRPRSFQFYRTASDGIRRGLSKRFSIIILYEIHEAQNQVEIFTVADSRQDWFK